MAENKKIKIENPLMVFTALSLFLISLVLIIVGIINFHKVEDVAPSTEDIGSQTSDDTQNLNDFFEKDFQDYEVSPDANLEYLKDDPFRGSCSGNEDEGKAPFSYGVVCLPIPKQ